jgi:RES domain-containing protein
MPDPRLIELIDQLPRTSFSGEAFRHQGPGYPPLNAEGSRIHGGRWNPKESFPVLYLALSETTAAAEFYRLADRQGLEAARLLPRRLYRYKVELSAVADLTDPDARQSIGLTPEHLVADDAQSCQEIGEAAHYAGFEAINAPSATGQGGILAVMFDRLKSGSSVNPLDFETWDALP